MTSCPSPDRLAALLNDGLPEGDREALEDHLGECGRCQEMLQELAVDSAAWQPWDRHLHKEHLSWPTRSGPGRPVGEAGQAAGVPVVPGYEVLGELGRGGMGIVYQARHLSLGRLVALKMLPPARQEDPEYRRRFRREAESLARLHHPHIVQIFDFGECTAGLYLTLELVEGGNLSRHLRETTVPAGEVARLVEILARTVHFAHDAGILHRDLKPANILLARQGSALSGGRPVSRTVSYRGEHYVPKVTDFGLARPMASPGVTRTGQGLGTPGYMAPEQVQGNPGWNTPAVDVYALGVVLYEGLTGRPPFRADSPFETLRLVVEEEPLPPSRIQRNLPRDLETICLKCLRKEPGGRYGSCAELAEDLERYLAGRPIRARRVPWWARLGKWVWRHPVAAALSLITAVSLVALLAVWARFTADLGRMADHLRRESEYARGQQRRAEENQKALDFQLRKQQVEFVQVGRLWQQHYQQLLDEPGLPVPEHVGERQRLIRDTLERIDQMLLKFPIGKESIGDRAEAYLRVGRARLDVGTAREGYVVLQRAVLLNEGLLARDPGNPKLAYRLAVALEDYAKAQRALGKPTEAEASYRRSLELIRALQEGDLPPGHSPALLRAFAATQLATLLLSKDPDQTAEAEALLVAAGQELGQAGVGGPTPAHVSATLQKALGLVHERKGQPEEAREAYRRALTLCEELLQTAPSDRTYLAAQAEASALLARLARRWGMDSEARTRLQEALRLQEQLAEEYPYFHRYRHAASRLRILLADLDLSHAQRTEALHGYHGAIAEQALLTKQLPDEWAYAEELGETLLVLARVEQPPASDLPTLLAEGAETLRPWMEGREGRPRARELALALHEARARVLTLLGREDEAREARAEARRLGQGGK